MVDTESAVYEAMLKSADSYIREAPWRLVANKAMAV